MVEENEQPKEETEKEEVKTDSQKLKEENDSLQAELERAQKIRNEALLAGTAGGKVEEKPKEETAAEYVKRVQEAGWKDERQGN